MKNPSRNPLAAMFPEELALIVSVLLAFLLVGGGMMYAAFSSMQQRRDADNWGALVASIQNGGKDIPSRIFANSAENEEARRVAGALVKYYSPGEGLRPYYDALVVPDLAPVLIGRFTIGDSYDLVTAFFESRKAEAEELEALLGGLRDSTADIAITPGSESGTYDILQWKTSDVFGKPVREIAAASTFRADAIPALEKASGFALAKATGTSVAAN